MKKPVKYSWSHFFPKEPLEITARKWNARACENFPAHDHGFIEIVVIIEGRIVQLSTSGRVELRKGDVVVLRPGSWHAYGAAQGVKAYNLCFTQHVLNAHLPTVENEPAVNFLLRRGPSLPNSHGVFRFRMTARQTGEIEALVRRLDVSKKSVPLRATAERIGLLAICLSRLAGVAYDRGKDSSPVTIASHALARKTLRIIEQDISQPHSLASLARELKTNKSYLARVFKRTVGLTVTKYLLQQRCEAAAVMLLSTAMPIRDIAGLVGYDDQNYFARCFRNHFGVPANKYRCRSAAGG